MSKIARRALHKHDIAIIDFDDLNAIAVVTDMSTDPSVTGGVGEPGLPAYKFVYIVGVAMPHDKPEPATGFIWLNDDQEQISIVGVDGCALPKWFYGVDVEAMFKEYGWM